MTMIRWGGQNTEKIIKIKLQNELKNTVPISSSILTIGRFLTISVALCIAAYAKDDNFERLNPFFILKF